MPAPKSSQVGKNWSAALREDGGAGLRIHIIANGPDIPSNLNGTVDVYIMAPEDGMLHSVEFSVSDDLAASDTIYLGFFLTNLGQNGLYYVEMLSSSPENTTRITGGSPLVANSRRVLKLTPVEELLKVTAGDRLRFRLGSTGNIAKSLRAPVVLLRFNP